MRFLLLALLASSLAVARGEPTPAADSSEAKRPDADRSEAKRPDAYRSEAKRPDAYRSEAKRPAVSDQAGLGYMYEYKKASASLVEMWRNYSRLDHAVRHLLRDYNVAVKQQRYRELVQRMARRQQQLELMMEQHKRGELSRHVVRAEITSLKELKQQLTVEFQELERLPSEQHPEKLLELIEFHETPVDLSSALRSENASLLRKSLKECSKLLHKLAKRQQEVSLLLKSLKYQANSSVHGVFVAQSAAIGNVFDPEAPLSIHMPVGKKM
ncbi:conserved hypothetical protein [Neospora caninum Liverpool]|uniref:Uncharacterized protein n=1 Tax=Neospora caninum (strain Liverpool) TaxID=572307 RepID=F0VKS6_NEOCL|nr:conserved hypothetical protein [Neospora caninum Liverpool]CBZ54677.1 conserved hypothetical protein [Neospora caninum Liverpool]CEL69393.1 TPA: hypothetical protein BN1204_051040 [Neospora caninum Liverpool]|eukprot:XP_003884707.1 conserved hypothetical protein [Neospora caninum Liverpool]